MSSERLFSQTLQQQEDELRAVHVDLHKSARWELGGDGNREGENIQGCRTHYAFRILTLTEPGKSVFSLSKTRSFTNEREECAL
jgi:hypothetical protein